MLLLKLFSRRWWFATLLVIAGTLVLIRLGIWQLDRLEQRLAFNAQVTAARSQSVLDLNQDQPVDVSAMEWRPVQVTGKYDFENQIAIRNQYYGEQYGFHLLTPLLSQGTAVLVDRGWIPAEGNPTPADWHKYDEAGVVTVIGQIRLGSGKPAIGGVADALPADGSKLALWNNADVAQVAKQLPYPLLPVYIQVNADATDTDPPIPFQPELELTEGPHFGYALQWFTFATLLFVGYPFFVRKQEADTK
jgi:surfeit locus 1 family protein